MFVDVEKAVYWYKLATLQGNALASYLLGLCYERGYGALNNAPDVREECIRLFEKAANQGNGAAIQKITALLNTPT